MRKTISVLGAGGTGQTFAADMGLAGHDVTVWAADEEPLDGIRAAGGITLTGNGRTGKSLPRLTTDLAEAVAGAELIVVCAVADRHGELARLCAPRLRGGQTVFVSAGCGASVLFERELRRIRGVHHGVLAGELEGNLYPCRLLRPAQVIAACAPARRRVAAFPAVHTPRLQTVLEGVLDTDAAAHVLEAALNSPNIVNHLMGSLLNLGAVERGGDGYCLYRSGLTPSVMHMLRAMNAEKEDVYRALGWTPRSPLVHLAKVAQRDRYPEQREFRELAGPDGPRHRYFSEDASTGMALFADVGRLAGVPTPLADGLLALIGALHGTDYRRCGRTLASLGLGGLNADQVRQTLETGY